MAIAFGALAASGAPRLIDWVGGADKQAEKRPSERPRLKTDHPAAGGFTPDDMTLQGCLKFVNSDGEDNRQSCRAQAIGNLVHKKGAQPAFALLQGKIDSGDATWRIDAHIITHAIGSAALSRYKGNVGLTFADGSLIGSAGFYHGVLLRVLRDVPMDRLGEVGRTVCAGDEIRQVPFLTYQCLHALGHGLMIFTGYDLPSVLKACDQLGPITDAFDCKTGAFMENYSEFLGTNPGIDSPWIRDDDMLYPCNAVAESHALACYVQVVDRIGYGLDWQWDKVAAVCRTITPVRYQSECFDSYGLWANHWAQGDTSKIRGFCRAAGSSEGQCIYGAARAMINSNLTEPAVHKRVRTLCDGSAPKFRGHCFYGAGTVLQKLGPAGHRTNCAKLSKRYLTDCLRTPEGVAQPHQAP